MYDLSRPYVVCWNEMADQMTTFLSVYGGPTPESVNMERSTDIVEQVGMYLFALYHVVIIIVLINMLIAMMSHSFEDIQVHVFFKIFKCLKELTHRIYIKMGRWSWPFFFFTKLSFFRKRPFGKCSYFKIWGIFLYFM